MQERMRLPKTVCTCRALCCAFSVVVLSAQLVAADFIFQFELSDVTTRGDCSGIDELSSACETYLSTFCLRSRNENSGCSFGSSGRYGPDFNFPVTRQISSTSAWPVNFQLFIRARDEDKPFGSDDDIDDIFINQSMEPNTGYSSVTEYLGNGGKVSVRLRYRIDCQPNFYGRNCAIFCTAQNDDVNGHYTCNSADGSIQCRDGFENPSNNCRDRITACSRSPCAQDAPCTPIGLTDYSCDCPPGYTGKSCETEINECDPNPCQNNATCIDLVADYTCQCLAGYSGRNCGIDIDDCAGVECPGNSTCIDGVDSFTCVCNHGFEGENCTEIDPCDSSPCANSGSCTSMGPFDFTCSGATDKTRLAKKSSLTIVIGAAIGGLVGMLIMIIIIIIVSICICLKRKTKQLDLSYDLPDELFSTSSTFTRADSHVYKTRDEVKEGSSVAPNPLYNSPHHQNGAAASSTTAEPYYSYITTTTSPDHSSTLHVVPNPIYGTQSPPPTADGVYSVPSPVTPTKRDLSKAAAEENPYSYAQVEISRMLINGSSGSVIRKDVPVPPQYEYISMAPAEPATPEKVSPDKLTIEKEPTVTLNVTSGGANGHTKVTFKRSIYDDDFQYEVVNTSGNTSGRVPVNATIVHATPDPNVQQSSPVPDPQLQLGSIPQNNHYDIPRSTGPPGKPAELTPTYGNISSPPPYDKLNHGTDFTQPTNSVRLGKVEGSGYELLNS